MATAKRIKPLPGDKFEPRHLASRPGRNDFLAATGHHDNQVRIYTKCAKGLSKRWKLTDKIGCQGSGHDKLKNPAGLCIDNKGRVVVCDHDNACVVRFTQDAKGDWECDVMITPEMLGMRLPCYVDASADGHVIVCVQSVDGHHSLLLFCK